MSEDYERFRMWFVEPLRSLEKMPGGQGGFVALATACFLYERYAVAALQKQGKKGDKTHIIQQLASDFTVDTATAKAFWDVIRNGVLHQGMPMQSRHGNPLPKWAFHHSYPLMSLDVVNGETWLKVQPWKFMNKVLELWDTNFDLIRVSGSFPWASIGPVPA